MSKGDGAAMLLAGAGFGIWTYYGGIKAFGLLKKIENTPTSKVIAAYPGTVELQGTARRFGELLTSPLEKKPCVYYKTVVKKWSGAGKNRHCEEVGRNVSSAWFLLHDDTGEIRVDPANLVTDQEGVKADDNKSIGGMPSFQGKMGLKDTAKWLLFMKSRAQIQPDSPLSEAEKSGAVASFIAENYPQLRGYNDKIDVSETFIEEGDPIYLLGAAQNDDWDGGGHLIMKNDGKHPFYISDGTEKDARKNLGHITYISLLGGPALFFACAFLLLTIYLKVGAFDAAWPLGAIAILMYAYAAIVYFLEMYNGIVLLKTQIEMARGNLGALYKRRQDLIPELETVVKGSARHEKVLQKAVAQIRQAALADRDKSIIGMLEAYPQIMANENFLKFQQELSDNETWIAGSRSFLVDSITLYNARILTFPYSVLAKIGGFQPASVEIG